MAIITINDFIRLSMIAVCKNQIKIHSMALEVNGEDENSMAKLIFWENTLKNNSWQTSFFLRKLNCSSSPIENEENLLLEQKIQEIKKVAVFGVKT